MKPWTTWNANSVFPSKWRAATDGSPSEGNMLDYIFALEGFFSPLKFVMKLYICSLFLEKTQIWANLQVSFSWSSCPRFCLTVQGRQTLSLPCCCECVSASLDAGSSLLSAPLFLVMLLHKIHTFALSSLWGLSSLTPNSRAFTARGLNWTLAPIST